MVSASVMPSRNSLRVVFRVLVVVFTQAKTWVFSSVSISDMIAFVERENVADALAVWEFTRDMTSEERWVREVSMSEA